MIRILLFLALIFLVAYLLLSVARRGRRQRTFVAVTGRTVSVRGARLNASMEWGAVRRIDVARAPTIGVEGFCVVLFGNNDESFAVHDVYDGFRTFQAEMFALWPQIKEEWTRIYRGPPDISERATLWKRDGG
ncbi:MAG TPA: hypothetical protein VGC27_07650 [Rhizomicrobium sp.]